MRFLLSLIVIVFLVSSAAAATGGKPRETPSWGTRWFADNSPWNVKITNPAPNGYDASVFQATGMTLNYNSFNWTSAIIYANSATDTLQSTVVLCHKYTSDANCDKDNPVGSFGYSEMTDVPIPTRLTQFPAYCDAHEDTDCSVCMYDANRNGFYNFWKVKWDGTTFSASAGHFNKMSDVGWGNGIGGSRANGCGGHIKQRELDANYIPHALQAAMPSDWNGSTWVFPAIASDGQTVTDATHPPQGSLLQLDPTLTDAQLSALGLTAKDIVVAHAMQQFGVYVTDSTGPMPFPGAIFFENYWDSGKTFASLGLSNSFPLPPSTTYWRVVKSPVNIGNTTLDTTNEYDSHDFFQHFE